MRYAAFVAHAPRDHALAARVRDVLAEADLPVAPVAAPLSADDAMAASLREAIEESAAMIAVLTPRSRNASILGLQMQHALDTGRRMLVLAAPGDIRPGRQLPPDALALPRVESKPQLEPLAKDQLLRAVRAAHRGAGRVVTVINMKGGVGKTTLAAHLFGCLQSVTQRSVLLIDLDPQHNLSQLLLPMDVLHRLWGEGRSVLAMFEPGRVGQPATSNDFINLKLGGAPARVADVSIALKPAARAAPRFDLVPGHFEAIKYALPRAGQFREPLMASFAAFIEQARKSYDAVVIDANPGAAFFTEAALINATHILSPVRPDRFSKRGLDLLTQLTDQVVTTRRAPTRVAIMNGVDPFEESVIEAEVRFSETHLMHARIAQSPFLHADTAPELRPDGDYTRTLAFNTVKADAKALRKDLTAAAIELAKLIDV
jgi:chromosome partitioning protein